MNKLKMSLTALYLALKDKGTPLWIKLGVIATVIYILSPIDLIPDLPVLGYIDDVMVLSLMITVLRKGIPEDIMKKAREAVNSQVNQTAADAEKYAEEKIIDYDEFIKSK